MEEGDVDEEERMLLTMLISFVAADDDDDDVEGRKSMRLVCSLKPENFEFVIAILDDDDDNEVPMMESSSFIKI